LIGSTRSTNENPTYFIRRSLDAVISDLRPSKIHSIPDAQNKSFNAHIDGAWRIRGGVATYETRGSWAIWMST
jgi:hypothetical protein